MNDQQTLCKRKEPRFKTNDDQALRCACFHEEDEPLRGSIIDISPSGLRLLCDGKFSVGQVVLFELVTDRSHGTFGGIVRRVEPWVGGQCLLGCSLVEKISDDILATLAHEGAINRRRDDRVDWNQPAKMSWELQAGEVDVKILDCSPEGMKVSSNAAIPESGSLRIRLETDNDEPLLIEATTVWQREEDEQHLAGVVFKSSETSAAVNQLLSKTHRCEAAGHSKAIYRSIRPSLVVAASIVLIGVALLQTGILP